MTFDAMRLPFFTFFARATPARNMVEAGDQADFRREYIDRLLSSESCTSEYGAQALMGLFPKDF